MKKTTLPHLPTVFILAAAWPVSGYIPSGIGKEHGGSQKTLYPREMSD